MTPPWLDGPSASQHVTVEVNMRQVMIEEAQRRMRADPKRWPTYQHAIRSLYADLGLDKKAAAPKNGDAR